MKNQIEGYKVEERSNQERNIEEIMQLFNKKDFNVKPETKK